MEAAADAFLGNKERAVPVAEPAKKRAPTRRERAHMRAMKLVKSEGSLGDLKLLLPPGLAFKRVLWEMDKAYENGGTPGEALRRKMLELAALSMVHSSVPVARRQGIEMYAKLSGIELLDREDEGAPRKGSPAGQSAIEALRGAVEGNG